MIKFYCKHCCQKISVPEVQAGRKGKCPRCKNVVIVPKAKDTAATLSRSISTDKKTSSRTSDLDPKVFDIPPTDETVNQPSSQAAVSDEAFEALRAHDERPAAPETEALGERKLPWLIDVFLYPVSTPGLINLAILIGVPFLMNVIAMLLGPFALAFGPIAFIVSIVIGLYMYWYFAECVRDSANGGIRAPETLAFSPGLGDMWAQALNILACLILFLGPAIFYSLFAKKTDTIFWALSGSGIFFFPMGLLAVLMFDSTSGLNPILLIGSIFRTFFPYFGLVLLFGAAALILRGVPDTGGLLALAVVFHCARVYLAFVAAHLLGRFYWRYQEKLNWEV